MSKKIIAIVSAVAVGLIVADTFAYFKNKRIAKEQIEKANDLISRINALMESEVSGAVKLDMLVANNGLIARRLSVQIGKATNYSAWIDDINGLANMVYSLTPVVERHEAALAAKG
jgi:hypothetical protein